MKGTTLRITETKNDATISLTSGLISVKNDTSMVDLTPGKRLKGITKTDHLPNKVEDIPYKLFLKSSNYELDFKGKSKESIRLTIQMSNVSDGSNIKRSGPIYFKSDYDQVRFPAKVMLDDQGFARIPININAPRANDNKFKGKIIIWAVMDGSGFDDIGEGTILLKVKGKQKKRRIRFDPNSGDIIPLK